jgi:hypothetical protein
VHRLRGGRDAYGESDVIMLALNGAMLLMEVMAGAIALRDGAFFKLYGDGTCDVARQEHLQRVAIQNRLQEARLETTLISCLVLPDYTLGDSQMASIPRERIIDAARYGEMVSTVRDWIGAAEDSADRDALRRLLLNQLQVTPHLGAMREGLQSAIRRLADSPATWVQRIEAPSGVVRIQATAGSGKAQLALQLLDNVIAAGRTVHYVSAFMTCRAAKS